MSRETLLRAAAALVVLLVAWGAFALFRGGLSDETARLGLPDVPAEQVDRIEIRNPADTLVLAREQGNRWTVNGRTASPAAVQEVLTALPDTAWTADLVARSASSHGRMGVDSAAGRHAVLFSGNDVVLDLWVGQGGQEFGTQYVRLAGADEVYLFRGRLASLLTRRLDAWRERNIASLPADSVGSIAVRAPDRQYVLRRAEGGWTVNGSPADSNEVRRMLEELAALRATAFPTAQEEDTISFGRPERELRVGTRTGAALLSLQFDSTAAGYWVRHDSGGTIWRMDSWRVERITPPESLLVRKD